MAKETRLTNEAVLIRLYRPSQVDRLYEAVRECIAELSLQTPWCHNDHSIEESKTWIGSHAEAWAKGSEYDFANTNSKHSIRIHSTRL